MTTAHRRTDDDSAAWWARLEREIADREDAVAREIRRRLPMCPKPHPAVKPNRRKVGWRRG